MRQRWERNASRDTGLSRIVSAFALIGLSVGFGSFDQFGTNPHSSSASFRVPSDFRPTTATSWDGAMLYRGSNSGGGSGRLKRSATARTGFDRVNRPHMGHVGVGGEVPSPLRRGSSDDLIDQHGHQRRLLGHVPVVAAGGPN